MEDNPSILNIYLQFLQEEVKENFEKLQKRLLGNTVEKDSNPHNKLGEIVFILGNTSCDMDSFISSLALSIFRNFIRNKSFFNILDKNQNKREALFVPVLNCRRRDLCDRLDIYYILKKHKINADYFIFVDDEIIQKEFNFILQCTVNGYAINSDNFQKGNPNEIELNKLKEIYYNNRSFILIDHNELAHSQCFLADLVYEIIDHHNDMENKITYKNLKKKNLVFPLGSCSSLILLEHINSLKNLLLNSSISSNKEAWDFFGVLFKDFHLFLAAILIDTRLFEEKEFEVRWNNLDLMAHEITLNAIKKIHEKAMSENTKYKINLDYSAKKLYEELMNTKYDEDANLNLGILKLLNKDKKEFRYDEKMFIWSSLQVDLNKIIDKYSYEALIEILNNLVLHKEKKYYIMNYRSIENKTIYTYIAFYFETWIDDSSKNNNIYNLYNALTNYISKELKEKFIDSNYINDLFIMKLDHSITRKNFEPLLNTFITNNQLKISS